jgi:hypothetical protein
MIAADSQINNISRKRAETQLSDVAPLREMLQLETYEVLETL